MAVMNMTEARINALALGSGIWRDEQAKGLMVICHASTKTYAVQGDVRRGGRHIRTVRIKIDRCDRIGLREARRRARELMSQIQSGVDPTSKPRETGMTVAQAFDAHVSERELRPSTSAKVLFVHGCFWHLHSSKSCHIRRMPKSNTSYWSPKLLRNQRRDAEHLRALRKMGWTSLVVWECELRNIKKVTGRIDRFIGGKS